MKKDRSLHETADRLSRTKTNRIKVATREPVKSDGEEGDEAFWNGYVYKKIGGEWYRTTNVWVQVT